MGFFMGERLTDVNSFVIEEHKERSLFYQVLQCMFWRFTHCEHSWRKLGNPNLVGSFLRQDSGFAKNGSYQRDYCETNNRCHQVWLLKCYVCALMVYWCKENTCMLESALSRGNYYVDVSFSYTIVTCRHSFLYLHYSQVCDRRKRCHHYLRLPVHLSVSSAELLLLPQGWRWVNPCLFSACILTRKLIKRREGVARKW